MPRHGPPSRLDLPPEEEVDRALSLDEADREEIPGLYRLNTERVPLLRVFGIQALIAFAALHNVVLDQGLDWRASLWISIGLELYAVGSLFLLRRYFTAFRRVHLGTLFLGLDLLAFTVVVYATGAGQSWLWPLYVLRVADQMWIGRRRGAVMAALGVLCYAGMLAFAEWGAGMDVAWTGALFRIGTLGAFSAYLLAASGLPWDLQERTHAAKELILRLEAQSLELDRERARAEHASMAKSNFLARMSHELRTPLNSVVGFANVLLKKRGAELRPREHDYLVRIRENGLHLLALINDVLDIARIEEGKLDIHPTRIDLEEMVRNTLHQMEGRFVGSKVRLSLSFPPDLAPLIADEARFRQVLINLVGNAIKFTPEGWIRVEVLADPDGGAPTELRVADSGIGIDSTRLEKIFQPFEQAEDGTARKYGGTGLGLAISRSLCELMGFTLSAQSAPGRGSTFRIDFRPTPAGGSALQSGVQPDVHGP